MTNGDSEDRRSYAVVPVIYKLFKTISGTTVLGTHPGNVFWREKLPGVRTGGLLHLFGSVNLRENPQIDPRLRASAQKLLAMQIADNNVKGFAPCYVEGNIPIGSTDLDLKVNRTDYGLIDVSGTIDSDRLYIGTLIDKIYQTIPSFK